MKDVYITRLSKFLPNNPIDNDKMEDKLGEIDGKTSKARRIVLVVLEGLCAGEVIS